MDRDRQYEWDKKHIRTVGTKLRRRDYERFKQFCETRGTTVYAWLREFVLYCLEQG